MAAKHRFQTVKGMRDLLQAEASAFAEVEETARRVFRLYGYDEVRTPVVEETDLFVRGVGEGSEIVGKQMYTFPDKKGRSLTLRPGRHGAGGARLPAAQHGRRGRSQSRSSTWGRTFATSAPKKAATVSSTRSALS